ncbi:MAG: FAD-dependent oxidoreductase [Coriobacteriia bacterium]|nr:FAD-dependent oxidoreductase [Coriobacteriia bacterium]
MKTEGLTRRGFIEGVGAAALGVTAASVLSGCKSGSTTTQQETAPKSEFVDQLNPQDDTYDKYTTDYAAIFSPIKIGKMNLKNRIIKTAAGSDTTDATKAWIAPISWEYYLNFAKGGAALVQCEGATLSHLGFSAVAAPTATMKVKTLEEGIPIAKAFADEVHKTGAYIGLQTGPNVNVDTSTAAQIKEAVRLYGLCAKRLQLAGWDCIEVKFSTGDGLSGFLTRRRNKRKDEYGGSLENRARLFVEQIKAVRENCGQDMAIMCHYDAYEENDAQLGVNDGYLTVEEAAAAAKLFEAAGADFIQVRCTTPGLESGRWAPDNMHAGFHADGMTGYGTMFDYRVHFQGLQDGKHYGAGGFIPAAAVVKKAVKIPVGTAGFMDPRTAPDLINNAVRDGLIDLVFMNRPLTVDPELPNKLQAKKRDEVAPCAHCFHCHSAGTADVSVRDPELCRVNAALQRAYNAALPEGYVLAAAKTVKNVMVIGGGPGGMEAARRAAQRGHKVTLYEKGSSLGGMVKTARAYKGVHERLDDHVAFLTKMMSLNKVTVVTGKEVDAAFVDTQKPDVVIVAVGGKRDSKFGSSTVASPKVVNMGSYNPSNVGSNVVVLGANAHATDLTLYLLAQGKKVQIVHSGIATEVAKEQSIHFRQYIPPHLQAKGVRIWSESTVQKIVDDGVVIKTAAGIESTLKCDTVIECWDMLDNTTLADALKSKYTVISIGDCTSSKDYERSAGQKRKFKNILYAIQGGYDAARSI